MEIVSDHITSPNLTPIISLSLAQCECANNSPEQPIKSSVPTCPYLLPRRAVHYPAWRVSDCFLSNVIDLVNEALRLPTSLGGAHNTTIEYKMREMTEEVAVSAWCGRSGSPNKTNEEKELTHPLYSVHDWRTKMPSSS